MSIDGTTKIAVPHPGKEFLRQDFGILLSGLCARILSNVKKRFMSVLSIAISAELEACPLRQENERRLKV